MCRADVEAQVGERAGERLQQARPVHALDLYDRELVGQIIVDRDLGGDAKRLGVAAQAMNLAAGARRHRLAGKQSGDRAADSFAAPQLLDVIFQLAAHEDRIERAAVGCGVDARADDVGAGR